MGLNIKSLLGSNLFRNIGKIKSATFRLEKHLPSYLAIAPRTKLPLLTIFEFELYTCLH